MRSINTSRAPGSEARVGCFRLDSLAQQRHCVCRPLASVLLDRSQPGLVRQARRIDEERHVATEDIGADLWISGGKEDHGGRWLMVGESRGEAIRRQPYIRSRGIPSGGAAQWWWPGAGSNRRPSDFQSDARTN